MSPLSSLFPSHVTASVAALLTDRDRAALATINLGNEKDTTQRVGVFLDSLFSRAPSEIVRRKTPHDLLPIVRGALATISEVSGAEDRIAHNLETTDSWVGLFLALDDHPFIISSVAECLYDAEISLECFQHPILTVKNERIAFSYLEIAPRSHQEVTQVLPTLRETLSNLKRVVADHELMLSRTSNIELSRDVSFKTEWGDLPSQEVDEFTRWITTGTFFFGAVSLWDNSFQLRECFGLLSGSGRYQEALRAELHKDFQSAQSTALSFSIHKLQLTSLVHRHVPLVHVLVRLNSEVSPWVSLVGYLTSKAWASEAEDIPILRYKLRQLLLNENTPPNSHDYKYVAEVIDNMPTDEALRLSVGDLRNIAHLALGSFSREDSRSLTCIDTQRRWALTVLVLPPERYSAEMSADVRSKIEAYLGAPPLSSEIHLDSSKKRQLRMYVCTPLPLGLRAIPDLESLARMLQRETLTWNEQLQAQLFSTNALMAGINLQFSDGYQASISISEACSDYALAAGLTRERPLAASFFFPTVSDSAPTLSVASIGRSISLSRAVPVLENLGIEVLDANSYLLSRNDEEIHVLKCVVRTYDNEPLTPSVCNESLSPALVRILMGIAMDDPLNLLLRKIPITVHQVSLLRCYCAFLWQTHKIATKRTMWKAVAYSPEVALHLIRMFEVAFDPALAIPIDERLRRRERSEHELQVALRKVSDITHDRILRALLALVKQTIRTNFYSSNETIALKVRSQQVEFMPHPRPLFEIFVFSARVEGTHLRTAMVARGGIRWSERLDDYRSEVLGLMKTQRVKNVIIVPSGAKGGFIIKQQPTSADAMPAAVETGYREYITALLSLADTIVDGSVRHPHNVIVHDGPDPYFVVAADKGTATFSDIANSIAQKEFSFWLGDAFASGGSAGYDHKKYGITAKGGWECVERHAKDLGIDTTLPFTAIGLGDMSGDVFGNAMMITPNLLLIGAFNHKHIFIDPTPNSGPAYEERVRLFKLPRSQWTDFNPSIISKGGGVFNRFDKEIPLSPEMREALGLNDEVPGTVDGETLISLLLKAPVTLMWNGGIGTYVKSRTESHSDVNDGANDAVRINADELRCKIVGEGGNLGFSQKARIEAAKLGIRINTDAIDNSGGVDLSDHEVNLKLLLNPLVAQGALPLQTRDSLLLDVANDVVESVLQHNRDQSLLLSMASLCSVKTLEQYRALVREMNVLGFLDRNRDNLPDEQELDQRNQKHTGMLRPELAQCSAAVKMWLKDGLKEASLLNDPTLQGFLLSYFPKRIQDEYTESVLNHPLRREIIANEIVGESTLAVGISFIPTIVSASNSSIENVIRCLLAADSILSSHQLRRRARALDTAGNFQVFSTVWNDIAMALRKATTWLLQSHGNETSLKGLLELYGEDFSLLGHHGHTLFSGDERTRFERRVSEYSALGLHQQDAITLSVYRRILVALEVLWCAREYHQEVTSVAKILSLSMDSLTLHPLFAFENSFQSNNKWEQELVSGSFQEIRRGLSHISGVLLTRTPTSESDFTSTLTSCRQYEVIRSVMREVQDGIRAKQPISPSVLPLLARHVRELANELREKFATR